MPYSSPIRAILERQRKWIIQRVAGQGDLIIGTKNRSAIGTIVERTIRYTLLVPLCNDRSAGSGTSGIIKVLERFPEHMRLSLTWDRGIEMAKHARISTQLTCKCSSATVPVPGKVAPTRTPTDCWANTRRKAQIRQSTVRQTYAAFRGN